VVDNQGKSRFDITHYLPNHHLPKLDRISLHHGIEARCPLLDHNIVEYVYSMPPELKEGKKILRDVTGYPFPETKKGFSLDMEKIYNDNLDYFKPLTDEASKELGLLASTWQQKTHLAIYSLWKKQFKL